MLEITDLRHRINVKAQFVSNFSLYPSQFLSRGPSWSRE
jgi:hypothetical protein